MGAVKNELITRVENIEYIGEQIAFFTGSAIAGDIDAIMRLNTLSKLFAQEVARLNEYTIG